MKLNDKAKEIAENWIEWANCYSELNKELESKNPKASTCIDLLEKRKRLANKRETLIKELQTIVDKTSDDIRLKIERLFPGK